MQYVFLEVWDKASLYDSNERPVFTWIINLGRLHAINRLGVPVSRDSNFEAGKEKINPKSNFTRIEDETELRKTVIQKALANLPDEERVSIEMLCFEGYRYYEKAGRLDRSVGTGKNRVYRVFSELRNLIAPYKEGLK